MTEEEIEVNYYYEKQAKVKVEYIDKQTGNKLDEEEIQGHVGDSYETEEKQFEGYDLVEKPSNSKQQDSSYILLRKESPSRRTLYRYKNWRRIRRTNST